MPLLSLIAVFEQLKKYGLNLVSQYHSTRHSNLTRPRINDDGWTRYDVVLNLLINTMLFSYSNPDSNSAPFSTSSPLLHKLKLMVQRTFPLQVKPGLRNLNSYAACNQ